MTMLILMLIFTDGGASGRLMPPTTVEFNTMDQCEHAAEIIRKEEEGARVYCIDKQESKS